MHIKVISTVVFASLAAAIAVPPFNGKTPPSTSLPPPPGPPPSGVPPSGVPPSGVPPTGTPLPKPFNATDQSLGQHKDNDGNNHLPRGDGGLLFPTNFPHLSLPTGKTPPPTSLSPPPGPPPSGVPPSGVPPSGTPLPKPSNANDKSFGQHKDTGSDGNTHHPRGDGDLPLLPTNYPHLSPPTGKTPPPTSLPPPPGPPPTGVPPSGVPPSGTPLPQPSNANDQSLGQHKDNDSDNAHHPRGDGYLPPPPPPTNTPVLPPFTGKPPPSPATSVPPTGSPLPQPANANDLKFKI